MDMDLGAASTSRSNADNGCRRDYTTEFTGTNETFKSREELINWAKKVGRSNGIYIVVSRSDSGKGKKKPSVTLACERSGKYDIRNIAEKTTKKCDCPFQLVGKKVAAGDEYWELMVVEGKHNHEAEDPTGKQLGHSYQGRLSQEEKSLVKCMYETGKPPKEILRALKEGDEHNKSTPRTIYNACQRLKELKRLESLDDKSSGILQQIMRQAEKYRFIIKKHKTASDYLLTHPTSLKLLLAFPTVLIMEHVEWAAPPCWAVLEVRGVTPTDVYFFVAWAITFTHGGSYEWKWALRSLRGVMNDCRITMPDIVILNISEDKIQPMKAINDVFPTAKVLISTVTISTSLCYNRVISKLKFVDSLLEKWDLLVASPTKADLERHVMQLRTDFHMYPQAIEYVIDTFLEPYKEMLVAAWTDKFMHFGITNSNFCSRSSTGFILLVHLYTHDGVDVDMQTEIDEFWEAIDNWIKYDDAEVNASLKKSLKNEYNDKDGFPELKKLYGTISIHALTLIRKETIEARKIAGENCSCAIRSTHGLPCAHVIAKYMREDQPIPPECINSYWRKLDLKSFSKTAEPFVEERLKRRRLSEEKTTTTDTILALPDIVESERNSPNAGPSIVPSTQARQPNDEVYDIPSTKQLELADICPPEMRPYIREVKDVRRDGHCGFRAIASFVGYSEDVGWLKVREDLTNELQLNSFHYAKLFGSDERVNELLDALACWESICLHKEHWMTMPDMGHIIASSYNIVLMHLSSAQCFTFFPLRTAPISITSPTEIVVGFVKDHFVQVYLERGHPMPPPVRAPIRKNRHEATIWERFHEQRSKEWAARYRTRIQDFTALQSEVVSQKNAIPVYVDLP